MSVSDITKKCTQMKRPSGDLIMKKSFISSKLDHTKITTINIQRLNKLKDKQLTVKERFYGTLQTVHNEIPRKDLLIITGDCNAKTGRDRCYRPVTGTYSLHEEHSENGEVLCLDAIETDMSTMSTYSQHETTQK
ncbi:hypothetical protein Cfor_03448, partial [Coptotermes formosanus]